ARGTAGEGRPARGGRGDLAHHRAPANAKSASNSHSQSRAMDRANPLGGGFRRKIVVHRASNGVVTFIVAIGFNHVYNAPAAVDEKPPLALGGLLRRAATGTSCAYAV